MPSPPEEPVLPALPRASFAVLFAVSVTTAVGNTGLISVLPAIGRSVGISDFLASRCSASPPCSGD
jgi:hypothetical protein